jgi:hypothetical protein
VGGIIPKRSQKPILTNAKLVATAGGFHVYATDLETQVSVTVGDAEGSPTGETLIPANVVAAIGKAVKSAPSLTIGQGTVDTLGMTSPTDDMLEYPIGGRFYPIQAVASNTSLTIVDNMASATASGQTYRIHRVSPGWGDAAEVNAKVSDTLEALRTGFAMTSLSSVALGTGSKTFTVQSGLPILPGARVIAAARASPTTQSMAGIVTAYTGTSLTINVGAASDVVGSGTIADWTINLTGPRGDAGPATISVGTVTTGAPGSNVSVTNTGTSSAAVLAFSIPRGDTYYEDGVSQAVGSGIVNAGGWYLPPSLRANMNLTRIHARVISGTSGSYALTVKRGTTVVWGPTNIPQATPVTETVNIAFTAGDAVVAEISDVNAVTAYVVQLSGVYG